MATGGGGGNRGRPLPKFGEWDASNPASAQGFTVIFNQARDDKKTKKTATPGPESIVSPPRIEEPPHHNNNNNKKNNKNNHHNRNSQPPQSKKKWLCFRVTE